MNVNLTEKERYLLEDAKSHEEVCIEKYNNYANQASDPQLKNIFTNNAKIEQEHLNTVNQLLSGNMPSTGGQQSAGGQTGGARQQSTGAQHTQSNVSNYNMQTDQKLCTDMLMTEKYVSGAYDTTIFECKDTQVRDVLNHIQKEEQKHGESITKYMESKGMYTPK